MQRRCSRLMMSLALPVLALFVLGLSAGGFAADGALEELEERAFKLASATAEPSIVRIETVGGVDLVGAVLTGTGPTTGVVVSADGYIITSSFNFISKPASILVTISDGRRFPAEFVASDSARMLTLIKIDLSKSSTTLTPIAAAPMEGFRVGQWSIALGRTFENEFPNMSVGIISALDRIWGRAVQTDAKTSPANYGGPLVDIEGRAIGVIVPLSPQKTDEAAGVEWYDGGIGFAIPMEDVYRVLDRLKQGENLKPGLLGVSFADQSPLAGECKVDRVRPDSPAAKAGMKGGDLIVKADGKAVDRVPALRHILGKKYSGETVAFTIKRGEESLDMQAELVAELLAYEAPYLGLLPTRASRSVNATNGTGVEVREVLAGSPAETAGLKRRDVITKCNGTAITDLASLKDIVGRGRPGDTIELVVRRGEEEETLLVKVIAIPDVIPDDLSPAAVAAPEAGAQDGVKVGRFADILAENNERQYWAYVPEQYNPEFPQGLVVWLHPANDTMEAAIIRLWKQELSRRGIILVAPKAANLGGWKPEETEFIKELVEHFTATYSIDPARVAVHGYAEGGRLAWNVGFKHRELFRGISAVSAPLSSRPPDNDPEFPVQIHVVCGDADPASAGVKKSAELLQGMKFPVSLRLTPGVAAAYPEEATIAELVRWLDALDRI